ncbi:MAG TPA: uridine kinase, partial [Mycobacteriales bacterium]
FLPTLWDPDADRATRAGYERAPPDAVLVLDGTLLLGRGLPADLTVHLRLSPAALARRTEEEWTLPAYERYRTDVDPEGTADVVVRADDPRHPALVVRSGTVRTRASR